jgi:predicted enzyme related to lactoylglutathione lyase
MAEDWARPVVFWEIQAKDAEKLSAFYGALFNWSMSEGPNIRIAPGIGGPLPGPGGSIRTSDHPGVSLYVQVLSIKDTLAKAATMGGKTILEPRLTPAGQTVGGMLDPEGNRLMLVEQ